jgi:hypothetical protein
MISRPNQIINIIKNVFINKALWLWIFAVYGLSLVIKILQSKKPYSMNYFISLFKFMPTNLIHFDSGYFIKIAESGYLNNDIIYRAFFPAYPILIFVLSLPLKILIGNMAASIAAIFISFVSLFFAIYLLNKLIKIDFDDSTVFNTNQILLLFPFSFFFLSAYSESLFLLSIVLSFYLARKNKWLLACLVAAFASSIRLPGILLFPVLIIEMLEQNDWKISKTFPKIFYTIIAPAGTIIYFLYLNFKAGGISTYFEAYKVGWPNRSFSIFFIKPILEPLYNLFFKHGVVRDPEIIGLAMFIFFCFGVFLMIRYHMRKSYLAFAIMSAILPLVTGTLDSLGRYYMVIFPLFIAYAIFFKNKFLAKSIYLILSTICLSIFMWFFIRGVFIG